MNHHIILNCNTVEDVMTHTQTSNYYIDISNNIITNDYIKKLDKIAEKYEIPFNDIKFDHSKPIMFINWDYDTLFPTNLLLSASSTIIFDDGIKYEKFKQFNFYSEIVFEESFLPKSKLIGKYGMLYNSYKNVLNYLLKKCNERFNPIIITNAEYGTINDFLTKLFDGLDFNKIPILYSRYQYHNKIMSLYLDIIKHFIMTDNSLIPKKCKVITFGNDKYSSLSRIILKKLKYNISYIGHIMYDKLYKINIPLVKNTPYETVEDCIINLLKVYKIISKMSIKPINFNKSKIEESISRKEYRYKLDPDKKTANYKKFIIYKKTYTPDPTKPDYLLWEYDYSPVKKKYIPTKNIYDLDGNDVQILDSETIAQFSTNKYKFNILVIYLLREYGYNINI